MLDESEVRNRINEIVDPCSAARGTPIGLADMGLVLGVTVAPAQDGGVDVEVLLRVTAPGCMFFIDFENRVRDALTAHGARSVTVRWDTAWDWTPADIVPEARDRLAEHRKAMLARYLTVTT